MPRTAATALVRIRQPSSDHEQVGQGGTELEPVQVLRQAPVTHLLEAEYPFDHADRVLDSGFNPRLGLILEPFDFVEPVPTAVLAVGEVLGTRRARGSRRSCTCALEARIVARSGADGVGRNAAHGGSCAAAAAATEVLYRSAPARLAGRRPGNGSLPGRGPAVTAAPASGDQNSIDTVPYNNRPIGENVATSALLSRNARGASGGILSVRLLTPNATFKCLNCELWKS